MLPGSSRVRVPSFAQCLPYLLNEHSHFGALDIAMICLLIRFIKPLIRFCLSASPGDCSSVPGLSRKLSGFLQTCGCPQPPPKDRSRHCSLLERSGNPAFAGLMVQGPTPAHKGDFPQRDHFMAPSRLLTYIPVSQGTHAGHTPAFQPDFAAHSWQ